jgi:hypothetical protein
VVKEQCRFYSVQCTSTVKATQQLRPWVLTKQKEVPTLGPPGHSQSAGPWPFRKEYVISLQETYYQYTESIYVYVSAVPKFF